MPSISMIGAHAMQLQAPGEQTLDVQRRIWAVATAAERWAGVQEAVPGMTNLTLVFDVPPDDPDVMARALLDAWRSVDPTIGIGKSIEIPVTYGGQHAIDLAAVARHAGLTAREVIEIHAAGDYAVYALGSLPGFAYLGGLDPRIAMPRKAVPTLSLIAGSVCIGGMQTGVGTVTGPSGWNAIGWTSVFLFDPERDPPALLAPGDRVVFRADRIEL